MKKLYEVVDMSRSRFRREVSGREDINSPYIMSPTLNATYEDISGSTHVWGNVYQEISGVQRLLGTDYEDISGTPQSLFS